jgi:hypothetical protein
MRRRAGGQCNETGVRVVHKRRSIQHANHCFFDVKYVHISQQFLVEQLWNPFFSPLRAEKNLRYSFHKP